VNVAKANRTTTVLLGDVAHVSCVVARVQHVSSSSGSDIYHHQAHGRTEKWTPETDWGAAVGGSCSMAQARLDQQMMR
jgi:hypothetical protein